jgi:hypothetical protein
VVTLQPLAVRADAAAVLPSVTAGSAANTMSAELVHTHANKVTTPTTRAFISRPGAKLRHPFTSNRCGQWRNAVFTGLRTGTLHCRNVGGLRLLPIIQPPTRFRGTLRHRSAIGPPQAGGIIAPCRNIKSAAFFSSGKRKFCDLNHSLKAGCGPYDSEIQSMEAAMTTAITSRVAIQARIVEWQRTFRNSDHGSSDFIPGSPRSRADWMRWFRAA